jgi:taurine dioxygenase
MARADFQVRRLSGSIGAEISGVDLALEASDAAISEIRKIWLEHNVVFFRDQELPPARLLAFAKRFGEVVEYPFIQGIDGFPEIITVVKLEHETTNFGGIWHTDTAYLDAPPMGTMLIAREVHPTVGIPYSPTPISLTRCYPTA